MDINNSYICIHMEMIEHGYFCCRVQKNVRKKVNMNVDMFYVVSVRMTRKIILKDRKVGKYGTDRN